MRWEVLFDEQVETMPAVWTRRLEDERFADQVGRCYAGSELYRERFDAARVPPDASRQIADIGDMPLLAAAELADSQSLHPPFGAFACAEPVEIVAVDHVRLDDGTLILTGYTERDVATSAVVGARSLWAAGIRPDDVVLDWRPFARPEAVQATGAARVGASALDAAEVLALWPRVAPTVLLAPASRALAVAKLARSRGTSPHALALRRVVVSDGALDERERLEDIWAAPVAGVYGHPLVWDVLAGECERHRGLHLSAQGAAFLELVDELDVAISFEDGVAGKAVLSHLDRDATPVLRLRTSERLAVIGGDCPCGRTGPRLQVVAGE